MKNINILLCVLLVLLSSCGEEFLDLQPETSRNSANFFQTAEDVNLAVIGCYESMSQRSFRGTLDGVPAGHGLFVASYLFMSEARSDNAYPTRAGLDQFWNDRWMDLPRFRITTSNTLVWDTYYKCYQGINACNNVLENIDNVPMTERQYNQYKGEVLFLRAWYYFHLLRNFGPVPITPGFISDPDAGYAVASNRRPVEEVYEMVEDDFNTAADLLPQARNYPNDQKGRASRGAALAALGKALLQQHKYPEAIAAFDRLIALNEYRLASNFEDVFAGELANINGESIFEVQYTGQTQFHTGRYASWSTFYETCMPSPVLKAAFYPGDLRLAKTIAVTGSPARDAFIKYPQFEQREELSGVYDGDNVILLRYADILLMYAEAENEANGPTPKAFEMINAVHAHPRTGLTTLKSADLTTKELFREAVARERQIELAFEGHRWYDLLRYGQEFTQEKMEAFDESITYDEIPFQFPRDLLYPIPQQEVALTGIEQNPGW